MMKLSTRAGMVESDADLALMQKKAPKHHAIAKRQEISELPGTAADSIETIRLVKSVRGSGWLHLGRAPENISGDIPG